MPNIILPPPISIDDKINIMRQDAAFDVADDNCTTDESMPDLSMLDQIRAPKSPPKVPKIFLSNDCIFNCAYCGCRNSHDTRNRYCNSPLELAKISVSEALKSKHGVFLSSAIYKNPDYTEELIIQTLKHIRNDLNYKGYVHAKIMPGTDPLLIREAGFYADRLSVNIEVAKSEGYLKIAKQKNKDNILSPMQHISNLIKTYKYERENFATSQTTQLMAGSTNEDDRTIMVLSEALYKKYSLKRVYYTPFQYRHPAKGYDSLDFVSTPHWRMRRLYQADRLLQLYKFSPDEVTPEEQPYLELDIDPKASWAARNFHLFPVEVNTADFEMLLRIPGIGITFAKKIIMARRHCIITHDILKKIGISPKKSIYFITCNGKYMGGKAFDNPIIRHLISDSNIKQNLAPGCYQMTFNDHLT